MNLVGKSIIALNFVVIIDASLVPPAGAGFGITTPLLRANTPDREEPAAQPQEMDQLNLFYLSHIRSTEYMDYIERNFLPDREFARLVERLPRLPNPADFDVRRPIDTYAIASTTTGTLFPRTAPRIASAQEPRTTSNTSIEFDLSQTTTSPPSQEQTTVSFTTPAADLGIVVIEVPIDQPTLADIPEDDFILSIATRLDLIRLDLLTPETCSPDRFYGALQVAMTPVNVALYILHLDVSRDSQCGTQDCEDYRRILQQTHFRMARLFHGALRMEGRDVQALPCTEEQAQLGRLGSVLEGLFGVVNTRMRMLAEGGCRGGPPMMRAAGRFIQTNEDGGVNIHGVDVPPEVVDMCCSCIWACVMDCIRRFTPTTTTTTTSTTTTTLAPTPSPAEIQRKEQLGQFLTLTTADIDTLLISVGMVDATTDEAVTTAIKDLRADFMTKFASITRGITANAPVGYDSSPIQNILLKLTDLYATGSTVAEWPNLRKGIMQSIGELRSEMYKLRAANV